ncbi:MAG: membrane-fusion protein, partial [SAR86 cluster bacterium]
VQTGQLAHIRLSAYKQRNLFSLEGRVTTISADRFSDERTGVDYFLARVELLDELPEGVELYPGMQAEVMVVTGARTLLEYLTRPITQSLNRALRES